MAIIEKPLNVFEIADLLGYYEYAPHPVTGQTVRKVDVGRMCTHPNVNKWAKYKPVRHSSKIELTPYQLEATNYGIQLPTYSSVQSLVDAIYFRPMPGDPDLSPVWKYLKPLGGANSPFRVADFNQYDDKAIIPFGVFNVTSRASKIGGNALIIGSIGTVTGSPTQLGWGDLVSGNRRLALAYRKGAGGELSTVVGNVGDLSVSLDVNDKNLSVGDYQSFLFLTNTLGNATSGVVGLEGHPKVFNFSVVTQTVTVTIEARWDKFEPNRLRANVITNNATGENVTLSNCILSLRNAVNPCDSVYQEHEEQIFTGSLVSPPGKSTIYSVDRVVNRSALPMWKLCWRNAGLYPNEFSANIIQEM